MTPQTDTMEINGLAEIASGIVGVVGGVFGGIRLGKSRQLEEIKEMIEVYKEAHNFTKEEAAELRIGIKASRDHQVSLKEQWSRGMLHLHRHLQQPNVTFNYHQYLAQLQLHDTLGNGL